MRYFAIFLVCISFAFLISCVSNGSSKYGSGGIPQRYDTGGEKIVLVYPKLHRWGAYDEDGNLLRSGVATSGGNWCSDVGRPCRTKVGVFRIRSLGDEDCYSTIYPRPNGGGLMPYCMFFNGGQALHGSPDPAVVEANISHGCVRMRIPDAEWLRYDFADHGTKVIIQPY